MYADAKNFVQTLDLEIDHTPKNAIRPTNLRKFLRPGCPESKLRVRLELAESN